jgi:hypothetical protein
LIGENGKVILLVLILVQELRIIVFRTGAGQLKDWRLAGIVRDLEIRVGTTQEQANPTRIIDQIGEFRESFILLRPIVDGVVGASRIFDSKVVMFIAADDIIVEKALRASDLKTGEDGFVRTAIVVRSPPFRSVPALV